MRTYVRAWINAWDVRRLYPDLDQGARPYEIDQVTTDYGEEHALESPPDGGAPTDEAPPDPDDW
jgi:hypothetical protein